MNDTSPYPRQLTGELAPNRRRGLWLVKWLLAIPHFIVLLFLWVGTRAAPNSPKRRAYEAAASKDSLSRR